MPSTNVTYYSDLLCVWAYVAQIKLDELRLQLGDRVAVTHRFCSVFTDSAGRVDRGWADRGGFEGYAEHVRSVVARFDHVSIHPDAWTRVRPATSMTGHAFVKAMTLACRDGEAEDAPLPACNGRTTLEELEWRVRLAFFRDARDIACLSVLEEVAAGLDLPTRAARARLEDGTAWAALAADYEAATADGVRGSPTFVLDGGRQVLYGNVGYKIIEANLLELLRDPGDRASWC